MRFKSAILTGAAVLVTVASSACAQTKVATAPAAAAPAPAAAPAAVKRPNFAGIWQLTTMERAVIPEQSGEFTPEAKAARDHFMANYKGEDADPAVAVCLVKGMPWTSLIRARDYAQEIYQTEDRIIVMYELYDQYRNIHINGGPKPEGYNDNPQGYSVAHWEGDTLVIETTGMTPLNMISPTPRGSNAKIVERWQLKNDPVYGETLVIDLEQIDPEVYVKPARGHNELRRSPPGTSVGGYGCSAALWDQHVDKVEARLAAQKAKGAK